MSVDTLGRAFETYRRTATSRSAIFLLIANAIPIIGVAFFGWSLFMILVLYWLENGIVGFWNVPKILMAQGSVIPTLPNLPDSAALAATGSPARAAELQAQWRAAQAAQAAQAADTQPGAAQPGAAQPAAAPAAAGQHLAAQPRAATQAAVQPATAASQPPAAQPAPAAPSNALPSTPSRPIPLLGPQATARLSAIPRIGLAMFFTFHYGMFWLVHGIFVFALPAFGNGFGAGNEPCLDIPFPDSVPACTTPFGELDWGSIAIAFVALFLSHGASFLFNYLGKGEYLTASPAGQMGGVYGRVVVLHLTIIFGSMVVAFLGAPIAALLILIVLKTGFDLSLHLREHRNAGPVPPAATPPFTPA